MEDRNIGPDRGVRALSVSFGCHCEERRKPVGERKWEVLARHYQCSAFYGYREMYSDYSLVRCKTCGAIGRTKAAYVNELPNAKEW
ncbi:MAG: hypothetical protein FJY85_07735 [Deltaproteobacteria bacterium]|nr:hypothetical protein [Deltaproteobacteria bacterium]